MRLLLFFSSLPIVAFAVGVAATLPPRIAIHWNLFGQANGSAPRDIAFAAALTLITGISLFAAAHIFRHRRVPSPETKPLLVTLGFMNALMTTVWCATAHANHGADDWSQAYLSAWVLVGVLVSSGAVAFALSRGLPHVAPPTRSVLPSVGLREGQSAVFYAQLRSPLIAACAAGTLCAAVVLSVGASWAWAVAGAALAALLGMFASVSLRIDSTGVHLAYGPFAFPRQSFPMSDIESAEAITVVPLAHGGWGYRGSLRLVGKAALVLRAGSGVRLRLSGDKSFVITVDDAESAAGLVNDLSRANCRMSGTDSR